MAGDKFLGVYFDSLGLFALQPIEDLRRLHNLDNLQLDAVLPPGQHLREFLKAEGYSERSYLGRGEAIEAAYRSDTRGGGVEWPRATVPMIKQKALIPEFWDATGSVRGHGAHMPLLFYVGNTKGCKGRGDTICKGLGGKGDTKGCEGKGDTKGCNGM